MREDDAATLQTLADRYGVSAERIRQIESKAIKTMRGADGRAAIGLIAARDSVARHTLAHIEAPGSGRFSFYSSTCVPSSTTRLVGTLKNSLALVAFLDIETNNRSRQSAMPGATVAIKRLARDKKRSVHHVERIAAATALLEQRRNVRIFLESKNASNCWKSHPSSSICKRSSGETCGMSRVVIVKQHHALVQHLVVLEVVQQRVRHPARHVGQEHRRARDANGWVRLDAAR
mgnify:CR=1 FL=1